MTIEYIQSDIKAWVNSTKETLALLRGQAFIGLPSCFPELDELIQGFIRGATTVVAGAPGMGKTAFTTNVVVRNVYFQNLHPKQRILMVSAEMGEHLWIQRVISLLTGIPQGMLVLGEYSEWWNGEEMEAIPEDVDVDGLIAQALECIATFPVELMGGGATDTFSIEQKLTELVFSEGLDIPLVIIDHAGVLSDVGEYDGAVARPDFICQRLESLAQKFNTHILTIWPLTKEGLRSGKIPSYGALRGSVMPSYQAANIIIVHSPMLAELQQASRSVVGRKVPVYLSVQKNRFMGRFEVVRVFFIPSVGRFVLHNDDEWMKRYRDYQCEFMRPKEQDDKEYANNHLEDIKCRRTSLTSKV